MPDIQELDVLRSRYDKLAAQRSAAEALLENAKKELAKLEAEAKETYGTSDLAELEAQLAKMEQENLEKRRAYQQQLDTIEEKLKEVEEKFPKE
jgi:predicted secreted Zn-dependent protease